MVLTIGQLEPRKSHKLLFVQLLWFARSTGM